MSPEEKLQRKVARAIQRQVAYFNGWRVNEETEWKDCLEAAKKAINIVKKDSQ